MLTRRCAVLGSPIGHSLSPRLHLAAYAALGLDWRYDSYDVDPDGLPAFVSALGAEWVGLSLTMPLKEVALAVADDVDPLAERVGAANTLILGDRRRALNTDVPGLQTVVQSALQSAGGAATPERGVDRPAAREAGGIDDPRTVTVLGGGATARSALVAVADWAVDAVLVVRDRSRVPDLRRLALPYPVRVVELADTGARCRALARQLVLSTVPAGTLDGLAVDVSAADGVSTGARLFVDVAYDPWPTGLAAAYQATGRTVIGGLDLLVRQAALQVEAMTGRSAPLQAMWAAVRPGS